MATMKKLLLACVMVMCANIHGGFDYKSTKGSTKTYKHSNSTKEKDITLYETPTAIKIVIDIPNPHVTYQMVYGKKNGVKEYTGKKEENGETKDKSPKLPEQNELKKYLNEFVDSHPTE